MKLVEPSKKASTDFSIKERGTRNISADELRVLQTQPAFRNLLKLKILSVGLRADGTFELKASHYVGNVNLENSWSITVIEKISGATEGLFSYLSKAKLKVPPGQTNSSIDGLFFIHIVEAFVNAVQEYVSVGRRKEYKCSEFDTRRPVGRILMAQTIRHHAKGEHSLVHVAQFRLSSNIFANQVIAYCLAEIELLAERYISLRGLLNKTRTLFLLFSDSNYASLKFTPHRARAAQLSKYVGTNSLSKELRTALEMAYPLLCGGGIFGNSHSDFKTQAILFDLEFLFEHSVLSLLQTHPDICTCSGDFFNKKLLGTQAGRYRCEPDLVISRVTGERLAIGDVKYKDLESALPDNGDVYQLLAHASAFGVSKSFLVYPSELYSHRLLGRSADSIEVSVFTVRPQFLSEDIKKMLIVLGL